jgi:dihydroxyacetone synthase
VNRGAIGMAAIGVALWKYVMRYAPHTPTYFNRDRFVLSNGMSLSKRSVLYEQY